MKTYLRDIILWTVVVVTTLLAVWFFFGTVKEEKTTVRTDLYDLIAPNPSAILAVNKPAVLTEVMLKHQLLYNIFSSHLPDIYLTILQKTPPKSTTLFSFHPQGVVMYTHSDGDLDLLIEQEVLKPNMGIYSPQITVKDGISFIYYPATDKRFFGYYQHQGVLIASYSKKLLETVARQQVKKEKKIDKDINKAREQADKYAPLNLLVPANSLNLHVNINDTLEWNICDKWLLADIFTSEGNICCFGSQPYYASLDTLYAPMADTLSKRIESIFPSLQISPTLNHDGNTMYYTGCSPM